MKRLNKKGFTLVEMLVVIAIIAILVAVIVPTVTGATVKASAATNAANLRSYLAEVQIYLLNNPAATIKAEDGTIDKTKVTSEVGTVPTAPKYKPVSGLTLTDSETAKVKQTNGELDAYFNDVYYNIAYFADVANTGTATPKA